MCLTALIVSVIYHTAEPHCWHSDQWKRSWKRMCAFYLWIHEEKLCRGARTCSIRFCRATMAVLLKPAFASNHRTHEDQWPSSLADLDSDNSPPPAAPLPPPSIIPALLYFTLWDHLDSFGVHGGVWGHTTSGEIGRVQPVEKNQVWSKRLNTGDIPSSPSCPGLLI